MLWCFLFSATEEKQGSATSELSGVNEKRTQNESLEECFVPAEVHKDADGHVVRSFGSGKEKAGVV